MASSSQKLDVIHRFPEQDLVLLKFPETGHTFRPIVIGNPSTTKPEPGDVLFTMGFPLDDDLAVTSGRLLNKNAERGRWLTDLNVTHGMSGGPVFNRDGVVVAMVVGGIWGSTVNRYVIPIQHAMMLLHMAGVLYESTTPSPFNGEWFSSQHRYGFRIEGSTGKATYSNSTKFAQGDVILRIESLSRDTFRGKQIYTNGEWYPVSGKLLDEQTLEMRDNQKVWTMSRQQPQIQPAIPRQQPTKEPLPVSPAQQNVRPAPTNEKRAPNPNWPYCEPVESGYIHPLCAERMLRAK